MLKLFRAHRFVLSLFLIGLVSSGCVYYNTFFNARQAFDEAEKIRKQTGQGSQAGYKTAIDKALKVVEDHPNSGYYDDALFVLGVSYYYSQQYLKSERRLRELLADFPKSKFVKEGTLYLAKSKLKIGEVDDAVALFDEIFQGKYEKVFRAEAAMELGQFHSDQKDQPSALRYYMAVRDSLGDEQQKLQAQQLIADGYFEDFKFSDALKGYLQVLGLKPNRNEKYHALYQAAVCSYRLQRITVGLDYLNKLIKDPIYFDSLGVLTLAVGEGHEDAGDLILAENVYQDVAVTSKNPNWAGEAYYRLGLIYQFDYDDPDQAKKYYDKSSQASGGTISGRDANARSADIGKFQNLMKAGLDTMAVRLAQEGLDSLSLADTFNIVLDSVWHPKPPSDSSDTTGTRRPRTGRDSLAVAAAGKPADSTGRKPADSLANKDTLALAGKRPSDSTALKGSPVSPPANPTALQDTLGAPRANPSPIADTSRVARQDTAASANSDTAAAARIAAHRRAMAARDSILAASRGPIIKRPSALPAADRAASRDTSAAASVTPAIDSSKGVAPHDSTQAPGTTQNPPRPPIVPTDSASAKLKDSTKAADSVAAKSREPVTAADSSAHKGSDSLAIRDTTKVIKPDSLAQKPKDTGSVRGSIVSRSDSAGIAAGKGAATRSDSAKASRPPNDTTGGKGSAGAAAKPAKDTGLTRQQVWKRINDAAQSQYTLAELNWFQLDKPDSAMKELTGLLETFPKSDIAPRAMIALSQMYRDYKSDTTTADSLLHQVLKDYPRSDHVQEAIGALGLKGTSADTGYAEYYMRKADSFLVDVKNYDSAAFYYRYVARRFPRSDFRDQATFNAVWVVENFESPGDSTVFYAYKRFTEAFPNSPLAPEATKRLVFTPPPRVKMPSDTANKKLATRADSLMATGPNLVATPVKSDTGSSYVDPLKAVYVGPKKEELILLEAQPAQTNIDFVYPNQASDLQGNQFELYFQILLDVTGRVIDLVLKIPSANDELNRRASATVGSMTFDPLAVSQQLQQKAHDLILPDDQTDLRGRWYVFKYVVSKPAYLSH